jgi:Flp pilus assembly protein TadD
MNQSHLNEAIALFELNKFPEAREKFLKLTGNNSPDMHIVFWHLSIIELKLNQFESALAWIDKALEIHPENANYHSEKGVIFHHLGKNSLALLSLNRALELDPSNPYRYSSRAYIKDALKDLSGAIADYKKAIELDPGDAVAHNNLGLLQEKLGWKNQAAQNFEKADKLSEDSFFYKNQKPNDESHSEAQNEQNSEQNLSTLQIMWKAVADKNMRKDYLHFLKKSLGFSK